MPQSILQKSKSRVTDSIHSSRRLHPEDRIVSESAVLVNRSRLGHTRVPVATLPCLGHPDFNRMRDLACTYGRTTLLQKTIKTPYSTIWWVTKTTHDRRTYGQMVACCRQLRSEKHVAYSVQTRVTRRIKLLQ